MTYTVFPLHPITSDGACTCSEGPSCQRPGKHPKIRWGDLEPGARVYGSAGHGLATGAKSGVFVVDTDGADADARLREVAERDGWLEDLDETYSVSTPSGGRHYYFVWPGFPVRNSQGEFDWSAERDGFAPNGKKASTKIDVRGDGGFAVMPGSPHRSGRPYEVANNVAPIAASDEFLAWPGLRGREIVEGEGAWRPFPVDLDTEHGRKRLELGREACENYPASIAGQNGSSCLWNLAIRLVRDLELPIDACADLVATSYNPRCAPPWNHQEVRHKLEDARDKSDKPPGFVTEFDLSKVNAPTPAPASSSRRRKQRTPGHKYTVAVGDIPNGAKVKTELANAAAILRVHPDWEGVLQYDAFRDRIFAVDPPIELDAETRGLSDSDIINIRLWFALAGGFLVSKDLTWEAVVAVAKKNSYHPVREWLEELPHVDGSFLDGAALAIFGREDALEAAMLKRFLVAAVRRVMNPGTKVDTMLVLTGPQGAGKSTFVRALFGEDWTAEDLPSLDKKDAVEVLRGKWCVEVAELDKVLRVDPETAKAFLSRCVDTFRPSYGRAPEDRARESVFVGTTNRDDFLKDATGSRRYLVIPATSVDLAWVRANRESLFAAARDLVSKGEPHWLTAEEDALRDERAKEWEERDPWHVAIVEYLVAKELVTAEDVYKHATCGTVENFDRKALLRVTDTLRKLGCSKILVGQGKRKLRKWVVPSELSSLAKLGPGGSVVSDLQLSKGYK